MNTKLFAIKLPEEEKNAMEYISNSTNNTLSKLFYRPLQDAIYKNLGLILLYKIDLRSNNKIPDMTRDVFSSEDLSNKSLPIIEDFIGLMLDKRVKAEFWSIFGELETNEKDLIFQNLNLPEIAENLGREYLAQQGNFEELDLTLARNIFFNYMLTIYFNITAVGSIQKLNNEWSTHKHKLKEYQSQLINKYLTRFQDKKVEAIKIDEALEVSEYIE